MRMSMVLFTRSPIFLSYDNDPRRFLRSRDVGAPGVQEAQLSSPPDRTFRQPLRGRTTLSTYRSDENIRFWGSIQETAASHNALGELYVKMNRLAEAEFEFMTAIGIRSRAGPDHVFDAAVSRENLAQVYEMTRRTPAAKNMRLLGAPNKILCAYYYAVFYCSDACQLRQSHRLLTRANSSIASSTAAVPSKTSPQAPNYPSTWSTSQSLRPAGSSGPRFEQTAMEVQPNPLSAMELIANEPIRLVHGRKAVCDGGE
ncbi:ubiquinone oxidoreductase kd [Salix suchowensis]|nr:ubiquinone oxidoreductase kd [Salix suchowensis]